MKIDIAIHTAQEGYSWQPGTNISAADLKEYKAAIGKFPSPDDPELPFGGIFLLNENVVFYRYHVAKKIDFLGRDALYCVLGVLSLADAARVNPKKLFALPQFAGPMKPFPTSAEADEVGIGEVPEWLRNLDIMSLDVRISGTIDNMKCDVKQKQVKFPPPKPKDEPRPEAVATPKQALSQAELNLGSPRSEEDQKSSATTTSDRSREGRGTSYADVMFSDKRKTGSGCRRKALIGASVIAAVTLVLVGALVYGAVRLVKSFRSNDDEKNKVTQSVEKK